jgi:hypothetical protein
MKALPSPDHVPMPLRAALKALPALLAVLAAAVLASGCGSATPGAVLDPVAKAATTTGNAEGAKLTMHLDVDLGSLGGHITVDAHGHLNFKNSEGEVDMQFTGLPAAASSVLPEGTTMTERFTGQTVYVGSPILAGKLPNGASWMKLDIGAAERKLGLDPQSLTSGQSNPAQFLEFLRASGGDVKAEGTDVVRGVTTTRYSGSVDLHKAAAQLPSGESKETREAFDKLISELGVSTIPVKAWVDSHNLVRRLVIEMPINAAGHHVDASITAEFFDFGPTPAVQAPAPAETYEVDTSALGGDASGLSG